MVFKNGDPENNGQRWIIQRTRRTT